MRILGIKTLSGPNVFHHKPVLVMRLDLEDLAETRSCDPPGFTDRLLTALPGLHDHHCAAGAPGGLVKRLQGGTYFGHVVEHVALELSIAVGIGVNHGKTIRGEREGVYQVVVRYLCEPGMKFLLHTAVELVQALLRNEPYPLDERVAQARRIVEEAALGPSTRAIVEAAIRRGIPWRRIHGSIIQLGHGRNIRRIEAAVGHATSAIGVDIAADKDLTKEVLKRAYIPVPRGTIVHTREEAIEALTDLGPPVVVKPLDGHQGQGVTLSITTPEEAGDAFVRAREFGRLVLVEELFHGRDYRVLVVGGRVVAASERVPARVTGDGEHTVEELVDLANQDPRRGDGHERPLTRLRLDEHALRCLARQGLSALGIPPAGRVVFLRDTANLSTGGTARDVTDEIHPTIARMCERAARVVGLDICGIDLVLPAIHEPLAGRRGGVIEVNAGPGLRMHQFPSEGRARDVGDAVVKLLYPEENNGRVPLISITGTNGKTTVTRMVSHIIGRTGVTVGCTTTDGTYVGQEQISVGDNTGPRSAQSVLGDPAVDVAVLETARGGIVRGGLGYDWSDISVVTNIQRDHLGQDGIESLEDLIHVKALVAERVRHGGTLVLNADDEHALGLADAPRVRSPRRNVVFFSLHADSPVVRAHCAANGTAYFPHDGWIIEQRGHHREPVARIHDIPVVMRGLAEFQLANALAAAAACRAYGLGADDISDGLRTFTALEHNPGRVNIFQVGRGYVVLDYGHNPEAFRAICRMAARMEGRRVTAILGVPGDRMDALIEEAARVAARGFSRIIVREDADRRGRQPGEIPLMLRNAIQQELPHRECRIIPDEVDALTTALHELQEGELVVVFHENRDRLLEALDAWDAQPVSSLPWLATSQAGRDLTL
ncbi:MAG: cyanophycin synthetase [Myxococcota bacterium]